MAQIAIPLVIAGVLYLASNEKDKNEAFTSAQYEKLVDDKNVLSQSNTNYASNTNADLKNKYDDYNNLMSKDNITYTKQKPKEDVTVLNNIDRTK